MAYANRIESTEVGSVAVITVFGEHDLSTQPCLTDAVARLARPGAVMVIDLSPATFIDSSVLHTLTSADKNAHTLAVVAPRRALPSPDRPGGPRWFLTVCDSTDQALRRVICSTQPRDGDDALGVLHLADHLLDLTWQDGHDLNEPLALARKLCQPVGREPRIEDAKLLIADAQHCCQAKHFQRLVELSPHRNEKIADLARRLTDGRLSEELPPLLGETGSYSAS